MNRRRPMSLVRRPQNSRRESAIAHRGSRQSRRGVETLELILAMPILLIASIAVLEFGILMLVQQAITTSAIEGAREAAKGSSAMEVAQVVDTFLTVHNIDGATAAMPDARVDVEKGPASATVGNSALNCEPTGPALGADEVRVTVCVTITDGDNPVPDWLSYFGFSLIGKTFQISSLAEME